MLSGNGCEEKLSHLDTSIDESPLDIADKAIARQEDRQGLGLTRKRGEARAEVLDNLITG